eukprot:gene42215-biopygen12534
MFFLAGVFVCLAKDAVAETGIVTVFADGLMGPDSIVPETTVIDTMLVFIGFDVDLATLQVYASNRCLLRALYCYFDIDFSIGAFRWTAVLNFHTSRFGVFVIYYERSVGADGVNLLPLGQGDSVAALSWAKSRRFQFATVGNAFLVYVMMLLQWNITVLEVVHVAAENNWRADMSSRDHMWSDVLETERNSAVPDEHFYSAFDENGSLDPEG